MYLNLFASFCLCPVLGVHVCACLCPSGQSKISFQFEMKFLEVCVRVCVNLWVMLLSDTLAFV